MGRQSRKIIGTSDVLFQQCRLDWPTGTAVLESGVANDLQSRLASKDSRASCARKRSGLDPSQCFSDWLGGNLSRSRPESHPAHSVRSQFPPVLDQRLPTTGGFG